MFGYSKQIFGIVPYLQQHAQYAACLGAFGSTDAFGHFALQHAAALLHQIAVVEHFEKYLRRYVVWIIAYEAEFLSMRQPGKVEPQKIGLDYTVAGQPGDISRAKVFHTLAVELHHSEVAPGVYEKLCKHASAGSYLYHGEPGTVVDGGGYASRNAEVGKEVLSQRFLGFYIRHIAVIR